MDKVMQNWRGGGGGGEGRISYIMVEVQMTYKYCVVKSSDVSRYHLFLKILTDLQIGDRFKKTEISDNMFLSFMRNIFNNSRLELFIVLQPKVHSKDRK